MKLLAFALFLHLTSFLFRKIGLWNLNWVVEELVCFGCLIDGLGNCKLWSTEEWMNQYEQLFFVCVFDFGIIFGYFIRWWSCKLVNISSTYNCKSQWRLSDFIQERWDYSIFVLLWTRRVCYKLNIVWVFWMNQIRIKWKIDIARVHQVVESHFLTLVLLWVWAFDTRRWLEPWKSCCWLILWVTVKSLVKFQQLGEK